MTTQPNSPISFLNENNVQVAAITTTSTPFIPTLPIIREQTKTVTFDPNVITLKPLGPDELLRKSVSKVDKRIKHHDDPKCIERNEKTKKSRFITSVKAGNIKTSEYCTSMDTIKVTEEWYNILLNHYLQSYPKPQFA